MKKYQWILVDEVEYTINDSGKFIYNSLLGAERMYAFSGTADKLEGKLITFASGITDTVMNNKDMISYFGPSLVFRMPTNLIIDNITVKTFALNQISFSDIDKAKDNNIYIEILSKIWTFDPICRIIQKLVRRFPMLFIPVNNLENIIQVWIDYYFRGVFRVLLICGKGYLYYDLNGNISNLSLEESCEYIKRGLVDVIPSTSAGFRALDFPGLENILLIANINAGSVLQSIGRCARGDHMNIISLEPRIDKRIPVYTKGLEHREEMIQNYYKYCIINNIEIDENNI